MIGIIIAILGGLLASSSIIIAKKPNAKELIDKITPFQGWIGVILAFWGLISSVLNIGNLGLYWMIALVVAIVEFVVGFLLGYGLISKYLLESNETAKEKGNALRMKLTRYQIPAGLILLVLGILSLVLFITG
ncbi:MULTISPECIES: hypothetical protein [unclassified Chryseobacterium]|uniref:hypothetical protein n=1 Tax=unclassified Chryseobacterium TaxID=2593645 RepID=UPI000D361E3C|nr:MULTISPECIES: hypothetical protein [unclassified Chryseobacterium]PTT74265.1 hypothetical protein DBR25_11195 [Chryseobacterium sp. HMWF001]PVV50481.1 hypothetical protein DD829_22185 [Chryseobacterium sp. HMWF035]